MELSRRRPRWPWAVAAIGLGVFALGFVPAWIDHHRELRGEGYRTLLIGISAWQLRSVPVLTGGVVGALAVALAAAAWPRSHRLLAIASAVPLGLLVAGLWPVVYDGNVTTVTLTPGWALPVAVVGVTAMFVLSLRASLAPVRTAVTAGLAALLIAVGGVGVRSALLADAVAFSPNWSPGTYVREVDGTRLELTLSGDAYAVGDWSGRLEPAELNIILTEDPACPEARALYRVRSAPATESGTLFEKVVDVCADGARAVTLEGVWHRAGD